MSIVRTEDVLGGEPRLDGRRISVLQIAERVIDAGQSPEHIADQLDLALGEIYHALAYYYDHIDEMNAIRERHHDLETELEDVALSPPETTENQLDN